MNKIRFGFITIVVIVSIAAIIIFNVNKNPLAKIAAGVFDFSITEVSSSGGLYVDRNPIKKEELFQSPKVDIKSLQDRGDQYIATDPHTAFEFYYSGFSFIVQPDSYLFYQPGVNALQFIEGEFLWHTETAGGNIDVSLGTPRGGLSRAITLSNEGKAAVSPTGTLIKVWNYAGELKFNDSGESINLQPNTYLEAAGNQRPSTALILEAPGFISPEEKLIVMSQPGDSLVKFNWKEVSGTQAYIFRLYSSKLRDNILYEKQVDVNRLNLDLLQFEDFGKFYWQVCAYDPISGREGTPSKLGVLTITGALFNRENMLKPPELLVKNMDVNGNLVLIEGKTDKNAQLYINNTPVTVNPDGTFIHTIHFTKIGKYKIIFRVVSAAGTETTLEKIANIYDE